MPQLGPFELVIILIIVLLVFGASRIKGVAGALGGSIKEFRHAVRDDENTVKTSENEPAETKVIR